MQTNSNENFIFHTVFKAVKPDPVLSVSDWADQYRYLSTKASAEPGKYRTDRTPYMREIMWELSTISPTKKVVFMKSSQCGAPLALNTKVMTLNGMKSILDIQSGDIVFGPDGKQKRVIGTSEIFENETCYELTFTDGSVVKCDGRHLWTFEKFKHSALFNKITIRTDEIAEIKLGDRHLYRLKIAEKLDFPEQKLPIGPYTMGAWLGNGNRNQNRISCFTPDSQEMAAKIRLEGHVCDIIKMEKRYDSVRDLVIDPVNNQDMCLRGHLYSEYGKTKKGTCKLCQRITSYHHQFGFDGKYPVQEPVRKKFGTHLRELGVFRNKHIPDRYLIGSYDQRLSLLQGLMDTDGHITPKGVCEFYSIYKHLAEQVQQLIASLGVKAKIFRKKNNPKSKGNNDIYVVRFVPYKTLPCFTLKRKFERLTEPNRVWKTKYNYLVDIKKVEGFKTKCIAVDSEDHLFLVGNTLIPTHNTEAGLCWLGYIMDHAPAPTLVVWPTTDMCRKNSRQRIDPLIEECPSLRDKVGEKKSRETSNTMFAKDFPGGVLVMTGANSATGLKSMPAKNIFGDEIDEFPIDVEGQGDPLSLAEKRAKTFSKRKIFYSSTPTIEGNSHIARQFEESDKRYFHVPCPECKGFQKLEFKQLKWENSDPKTAYYECIHCQYKIQNWQKTNMLLSGRWQAEAVSDIAGFHINALYSPVGWLSWEEIVQDFLKSKGNPEKLKTFVNTILGETWKEQGEAPDYHRLYERREQYPRNLVPHHAVFLTMGVDIQQDRIECLIKAWCKNKVSYAIDYRILRGDTAQEEVWSELDKVIHETFPVERDMGEMPIKLTCIDSGYQTNTVYNFVRRYPQTKVVAIKGVDYLNVLVGTPKAVDVTVAGKPIRRGIKVWPLGVGLLKSELYGWLRQNKPVEGEEEPHGYCYFPEFDIDFFKGLVAEQIVYIVKKGYKTPQWTKIYERNEPLDLSCYARAAAALCGLDRLRDFPPKKFPPFTDKETLAETKSKNDIVDTSPVVPKIKPKRKRERENWF